MKKLFVILFTLVLDCGLIPAQENLFEKTNANDASTKSINEKIERFKSRDAVKNWERVSLKYDIVFSKNFKGIFNIFDKNLEFEITKDFGTDINGIQGFKADIKEGGYAILSRSDNGIGASIWHKGNFYSIESVEDGVYFVSESDMTEITKGESPNDYPNEIKLGKTGSSTSVKSTLSSAAVKVYVAYTSAVAQNYNIDNLMTACENTTKDAFENSDIASSIDIVGYSQLSYTESGDDETDINYFMTKSDGYLDEIHSLRNQYEADICVLLVNTLDNHGYAASTGADFSNAFCVVRANSAVSYNTFPHELAHLFGCRHEVEDDPSSTPYANGHGFSWYGRLYGTSRWYCTIMSLKQAQFQTKYLRVPYFSNPDVLDDSDNPMGTLNTNYCAYAIDDYASNIAALEPYHTTSGTMDVNEWWSGTVNVTGNITIASGVSLIIAAGTQISFASGSSITVNGTLNASGTSSSPITFDFISSNSTTQNGIKFNSGSSGTINYCQIRNAYRGIYENGVNINLTNTAISNCYNGIYLSNSSPTIQYCNIHDNVNAGIYAINSASPYLYNNYMSNNYYGVYCTTNSNPKFGNGSTQGKNGLTNNYCGVYCYNNSYPILGQSLPLNGGYNNLLNAAHNIYNASSGTVYAHHIWWGTTTPANFKIYGSGTTSYTDYLSSSVTISPAPPLSKTGGGLYASAKDEIPMLSELDRAYELVASNNLNEARTVCMNLINNYPDYSVAHNALNLLKETYTNKETTSKNNIYKTLFKEKGNKDLYAIAGLILSDIDKENKLKHIDEVINKYKGESVIELALFDKFVYYYFDMEDEKSARAISDELDAQFPKSIGAIEAHKILGDEEYFNMNWEIRPEAETAKQAAEENKFDMDDNYPNPFNPSTTISYSLPTNGNVQIKIFDVLGSEIVKLVDETKSAGKHSVEWNGSNYASGIYFYTITFNNQTLYKKMLMIK